MATLAWNGGSGGSKGNIGKKRVNNNVDEFKVLEITLPVTMGPWKSALYQNNSNYGDVKISQFGCMIRFDGILQSYKLITNKHWPHTSNNFYFYIHWPFYSSARK